MSGHRCKTCHVVKHALGCLESPEVELSRHRMGAPGENQLLEARHWLKEYYKFHQKMHLKKREPGWGET